MTDQSSVFAEQTPQETPAQEQAPSQEPQAQQEQAPQQSAQPAAPQPSDNVFADQLASIKNERGEPKYRDLPTALDALKNSQEYIPQLKQDNETLRSEVERLKAELEQRGSLEETIERLTARGQDAPSPQEMQGMSQEQIEALLDQRLSQREKNQMAQANVQKVEKAIREQYGDKAQEVARSKAEELGIPVTKFMEMAAESPQMVLTLFNVSSQTPQGKPPASSVNIPPVAPREENAPPKPSRSMLSGASSKDMAAYMRELREYTDKRLGVTRD